MVSNIHGIFYFQPRDFWKEELKDFSSSNKNGESGPLLLDVLEGYLKYEVGPLM